MPNTEQRSATDKRYDIRRQISILMLEIQRRASETDLSIKYVNLPISFALKRKDSKKSYFMIAEASCSFNGKDHEINTPWWEGDLMLICFKKGSSYVYQAYGIEEANICNFAYWKVFSV